MSFLWLREGASADWSGPSLPHYEPCDEKNRQEFLQLWTTVNACGHYGIFQHIYELTEGDLAPIVGVEESGHMVFDRMEEISLMGFLFFGTSVFLERENYPSGRDWERETRKQFWMQ